jgi:hypothetical protein
MCSAPAVDPVPLSKEERQRLLVLGHKREDSELASCV